MNLRISFASGAQLQLGYRMGGHESVWAQADAQAAARPVSGPPPVFLALPADATARVQDGALEGSNVSAVETMVSMISAARQFEAQMRLLQTAESNDRSAGQLLGLQG